MLSVRKHVKQRNELNRVIPVKEITDLIRYKDGTYRKVLKVTDPLNVKLMGRDELLRAIRSLKSVFNMLDTGQTCQILITSDPADIEDYLWEVYGKLEEARQRKNHFVADRLKGLSKYLEEHGMSRNVHNFYLILQSRSKKRELAEQELDNLTSSVRSQLGECDIKVDSLDRDGISKAIYQYLSPVKSLASPYKPGMNLMRWRPPDVEDCGSYLIMDHTYYRFYTISYMPEEIVAGWLDNLLSLKINLDISICLRPVPKAAIIKRINEKISDYQAMEIDHLPESVKQDYEEKIQSNKELIQQIRPQSENLLATTFLMAVRADSKKELDSACEIFEQNVTDVHVKKALHEGIHLLWHFLPIGHIDDEVERRYHWPLPAESAAFTLPFNSPEVNFNEGILRGINVQTDSPVILNPWNEAIFHNRNEFKVGLPGSGKTFALVIETFREYVMGLTKRQILFDVEREFGKYFPFANRVVFSPGSDFCTNPFHIRSYVVDHDDPEQERIDLQTYLPLKISRMKSFFRWIHSEMTPLESAKLSEAIQKCYEKVGLYVRKPGEPKRNLKLPEEFPTLGDLDEELKKIPGCEDMRRIFHPYIWGEYASMFNGQTNWHLDGAINILDIHDLTEDVRKPMMDRLLEEVWEEIKKDRSEKMVLRIDEFGLLADERNSQTMQFAHDMAKRIRKYGGGLCVATQNMADFLSNGKWGTAVLNNCEIQHYMGLRNHDIKELVEKADMEFNHKELEILRKSEARGHGILILGHKKRIELQTECSPDEQECLNLRLTKKFPESANSSRKDNVVSMVDRIGGIGGGSN